MRAIVHDKYGSFDVLGVRDIDQPVVKDDEVLVRVHAAGLHVGDCFGVRGAPFAMRLVTGLLKPKHGVPGFDVAGQVEALGTNVMQFRPGDEVFGACSGACAEYVCVGIDKLALKPANLTLEEAAAESSSSCNQRPDLREPASIRSVVLCRCCSAIQSQINDTAT